MSLSPYNEHQVLMIYQDISHPSREQLAFLRNMTPHPNEHTFRSHLNVSRQTPKNCITLFQVRYRATPIRLLCHNNGGAKWEGSAELGYITLIHVNISRTESHYQVDQLQHPHPTSDLVITDSRPSIIRDLVAAAASPLASTIIIAATA